MKRFKNILVAADTNLEQHPIVDEAGEIAEHNSASLKIVDVVPQLPWTARFMMRDDQQVRELIAQEKQQRLDAIAFPLRERGVNVSTKALFGARSVEIIREVLRDRHDLVLAVAKGSQSRRKGFFGTTAVRLLRKCPCPVWLVSPETTPRFRHVVGCVDTSSDEPAEIELREMVYELASSISEYHGGRFSIVHAWEFWNERMLEWHVKPEELDQWEHGIEQEEQKRMNQFLKPHDLSIDSENVHLIKGEPNEVIPQFVKENEADLLVMGTVARSGLQGMIMGNTSEMILSDVECSVLAVKPSTFVSPVKIEES